MVELFGFMKYCNVTYTYIVIFDGHQITSICIEGMTCRKLSSRLVLSNHLVGIPNCFKQHASFELFTENLFDRQRRVIDVDPLDMMQLQN